MIGGAGGFTVAFQAETGACIATQIDAGLSIAQARATPERLTLSAEPGDTTLRLEVQDRSVLSTSLQAIGDGVPNVVFPDALQFWAAFSQADDLVFDGATPRRLELRDQAAVLDLMTACLRAAP
ncbi:MAG: hypothetical protein AAGA70_00060 [Pseudomonadota bacterium]